jgi:hypothetical protein
MTMSGYIDLCRTGYTPFDAVLEAIEDAGNAYHHTAQWQDDDNGEPSHIERINEKINDVCIALSNANTIQIPLAEYEKLKADAERLEEKNLELLALLEEAESVLRIAGCTITSDKIADAVCRKECHD